MKKRIAILLIAGALSVSMMTGCSKSKSEETNKKTETSVSVKKTEKKTSEEVKTIGEKTDGAFEVKLTNSTGQDITAVTVKTSNEDAYPASMLKSGDTFAKDEVRTLYYKPSEDAAKSTATETGKELPVEYTVHLTLADKSTLELHAFPFDSLKEATILVQDGIAYVTYEQDGKEVSTLEAEKAIKTQAETAAAQAKEAEAAAQAEAAAAAEAQAAAEAANTSSASTASTESDTTYTEPAETYTEPAQTTESAASTETDNSAASEGCITDGLTY